VEAKKKKGSVFVGNGEAVAHKNTSLLFLGQNPTFYVTTIKWRATVEAKQHV